MSRRMDDLIPRLLGDSRWPEAACRVSVQTAAPSRTQPIPASLDPALAAMLGFSGIASVYTHQSAALERALGGRNVLLATPTASGKSLCFQLPILQRALEDPAATALAFFPFKALARDQAKSIQQLAGQLNFADSRPLTAVYDGDTKQAERRKIRSNPPRILITNPDIVHYSILPVHTRWHDVLKTVRIIVVDEIHTYRGVFGSHVLQIFRRFKRILNHYGARPQFIACSATVGNPLELAGLLLGEAFELITDSGAPVREKGRILYLPEERRASTEAVHMFEACLKHGLKTIVFTKSRRSTELIYRYLTRRNPGFQDRISVYRAGFLPEDRREIEKALFEDRLDGVISTSALELGIDIGGLDCCIMVGFPGSVSSFRQRAGRVGRSETPSLVVYIAGEDALDKYWFDHADELDGIPVEKAVIYDTNNLITDSHLECAADELPLQPGINFPDTAHIQDRLNALAAANQLLESESGDMYLCRTPRPHQRISIRSPGENFKIVLKDGTVIGDIDGIRMMKECHPGAVYLHMGRIFRVTDVDTANFKVVVTAGPADVYTQALASKETDILEIDGSCTVPGAELFWGRLKVREQVTGYRVRRLESNEIVTRHPLDMPEIEYETRGIWFSFQPELVAYLKTMELHPMGGLHGFEHALIGLYPLVSLCDRNDLAGISTTAHAQTGGAAVFVYDAMPGGLGLAESALPSMATLIEKTLANVETCGCSAGCPRCIHSPKCGSGNVPLDKQGVIQLLKGLHGDFTPEKEVQLDMNFQSPAPPPCSDWDMPALPPESDCPAGTDIVFDIETQLSAEDVGGWRNAHKMRIAVAVVYDRSLDRYEVYQEHDADRLLRRIQNARTVIGFNSDNFDTKVLRGYGGDTFSIPRSLDILQEIMAQLGHRLSLNQVAAATLNAEKSADGLQSLQWWKEGRLDLITQYCIKDVEITNAVYQYGIDNGYLLYHHRSGMKARIPVSWS